MRLIVGLGNPGREYTNSRHNVGFKCIDRMARRWEINLSERRTRAVFGHGQLGNGPIVLAKLRTFMNRSGYGARYLLTRFSLSPEDLVVIYDDMDLPLGRIRIRPRGSPGGHNGIDSIVKVLATREFPRVRVGIGRPPESVDSVDYVLGPFRQEEREVIAEAVVRVEEAVDSLLTEGLETAMNRFN